jgi:hypothetical protein
MIGPLFIVGSPRSGTTLLRMVMNAHPRIAMPHECNVVHTVLRAFPDPSAPVDDPGRFARIVAGVRRFERVFGMTAEDAARAVEGATDRTPGELLARIYRASKGVDPGNGTVVWGDKFILLGEYVTDLARYFPEARFVHLVRDARDSVPSIRENFTAHRTPSGRFFATRRVVGSALLWRYMVDACDRDTDSLDPGRAVTVRYEDLVRDADPIARRLCDLVGLPFEPRMLDPERRRAERNAIPNDSAARYHANVAKPLDTARIGRGERDLGPHELAMIEAICGSALRRHGYETAAADDAPGIAVRTRLLEYRVTALLEDAGRRVARSVLRPRGGSQEL